MPTQDYEPSMESLSAVAIGNMKPDPKAVEAIREATEKRNKPAVKADADAWKRSKNKAYRRKIAQQKMDGSLEYRHQRKKGR